MPLAEASSNGRTCSATLQRYSLLPALLLLCCRALSPRLSAAAVRKRDATFDVAARASLSLLFFR